MKKSLEIIVPENVRPGKFLQKVIKKDGRTGINLPALVDGLKPEYLFGLAEDYKEWDAALEDCNSCQSHSHLMAQYHKVWSSLGIDLAIVKTGDKTVARCLVNLATGAMSNCYGEGHYLLYNRLKFAGFEEGELVPYSVIQDELQKGVTEKNDLGWQRENPKSKRYWYLETLRDNSEETEDIKNDMKFWCRSYHVDNDALKIVANQRRYERACRKQGVEIGNPVTVRVTVVRPISDEWEYRKGFESSERSEFYVDSVKTFVSVAYEHKEGWYPKENKIDTWWGTPEGE